MPLAIINEPLLIRSTMDSNTRAMMDSPKTRRPFGEITNNSLNIKKEAMAITPRKEDQPPKEEEALTPLANLKMLIRVASETSTTASEVPPPKRELFRYRAFYLNFRAIFKSSTNAALCNLSCKTVSPCNNRKGCASLKQNVPFSKIQNVFSLGTMRTMTTIPCQRPD